MSQYRNTFFRDPGQSLSYIDPLFLHLLFCNELVPFLYRRTDTLGITQNTV